MNFNFQFVRKMKSIRVVPRDCNQFFMIFRWQDLYDFFGGEGKWSKKGKNYSLGVFFVKTYIIHYLEAITKRWASTLLLHENLQLFLFLKYLL